MKTVRVLSALVYGPENTQYLPGCANISMEDADADHLASLSLVEVVQAESAPAAVSGDQARPAPPETAKEVSNAG